jgi:hypothetical protein
MLGEVMIPIVRNLRLLLRRNLNRIVPPLYIHRRTLKMPRLCRVSVSPMNNLAPLLPGALPVRTLSYKCRGAVYGPMMFGVMNLRGLGSSRAMLLGRV